MEVASMPGPYYEVPLRPDLPKIGLALSESGDFLRPRTIRYVPISRLTIAAQIAGGDDIVVMVMRPASMVAANGLDVPVGTN